MLRDLLAAILLALPSNTMADIAGERVRLHGIDAPEAGQTCRDENGTEWRCGQALPRLALPVDRLVH